MKSTRLKCQNVLSGPVRYTTAHCALCLLTVLSFWAHCRFEYPTFLMAVWGHVSSSVQLLSGNDTNHFQAGAFHYQFVIHTRTHPLPEFSFPLEWQLAAFKMVATPSVWVPEWTWWAEAPWPPTMDTYVEWKINFVLWKYWRLRVACNQRKI